MAKKISEKFNPEKYMQMAIDAMNDSIEEPRTDGKVSPKVGAVLIKPNGTVESASRGELRFGDHAEFTLLERKNRSEKLDGSILFATLEPCAPGARRHPKLDVKAFRAPSLSRNPKITYVFNRMGLMEESELGMETFRGMQEKYELPLPFYDYKAPYLSLTFSRSIEAAKSLSGNKALGNLNKEELLGFEWVKSKGEVSKKEYAKHFDFDEKKAYRHLSKFKKLELVGDNGESPKSHNYKYVFINA